MRPPLFEVIRHHEASGRVQLHAWDFIVEGAAENEARLMNGLRDPEGKTLAASGLLETGWTYLARQQGQPIVQRPAHTNGVTKRRRSTTLKGRAAR